MVRRTKVVPPKPSAEKTSLKTQKPIGTIPKQLKVTFPDDDVTVGTDNQSRGDKLEGARKGEAHPASTSKPSKAKPRKVRTPAAIRSVAEQTKDALEKIGGILTTLSPEARFAVLKKVNGVFGQSKDNVSKKTSQSPQKSVNKPTAKLSKNSFNEEILKTHIGIILNETSKTMKRAAKSTSVRPSTELYELHRCMLTKRADVKSGVKVMPKETPDLDGETVVNQLLSFHKSVKAEHVKEGVEVPTPDSIFEFGWRLIRGETPQNPFALTGKIPDVATCTVASRTVPRTDDETEERAAALLASKKSRKQRKENKPDNQVPIPKRARLDETSSQESDSQSSSKGAASVEMETEDST